MSKDMPKYQIKIGNDGEHYAVFRNNIDAEYAESHFVGCRVACFNGYDNAYELNSHWWHRSGRTKAGNNIC